MGCGASTANGAAPASPSAAAPAPKAAAAPAAGAPPAGAAKTPAPWTNGTGIQFWSPSASHRDPIAISGDVKCSKANLKKVVILFDPRHLGFNKSFVTKVRETLFKHKERTHGAEDWNAVDTAAGYSADLKIRTLMITATLNSKPEFCTAIEAGILGMGFLNTLVGSGWKGAPTMLKIVAADDFYPDPDGVLYKLYGQYDAAGNGGKSSAWKAFASAGKAEIDAMSMLKDKYEKDCAPQQAFGHLAGDAGLDEKECMGAMGDLTNFISKCIPSDANVATKKSTTRDAKTELPAENLENVIKNVTWPSNRRPVMFTMSTSSFENHKAKFSSQFFDRPVFDLEAELPDPTVDAARTIVKEKIINNQEGHHKRKPIFLVGVDDLDEARMTRLMAMLKACEESDADDGMPEVTGVTVLIHGSSYEAFTNNKLTGQAICGGLLMAHLCVLALSPMLDRLTNMFLAPSNEAVVDAVRAAMVPFSGMHLMCTHNALGQEISDGGIMTTEYMVANPGTGKTGNHMKMIQDRFINPVKFQATHNRQLVLSDASGAKKLYRLRFATKYDYNLKPCSLIMPARIIAKLCQTCAEEPAAVGDITADKITEVLNDYATAILRVADGGKFIG
ncbi:unnamed protein product [Amoebophrya sp. A120]|nr:unnamed protein product [Amoebophrya sp. A120]|eukprot:GSA120T00019518001.1